MPNQPAGFAMGYAGAVPDDRDQAGNRLGPVEGDQIGRADAVDERRNLCRIARGEMPGQVHTEEPMRWVPLPVFDQGSNISYGYLR